MLREDTMIERDAIRTFQRFGALECGIAGYD